MKRLTVLLTAALVSAVFMMGCRTAPVINIEQSEIVVDGKYTLENVKKAIIRAGAGLGWQMKTVGSNKLVGTLHLRKHMAKVEITYNKKSYSINYKDSQNLSYDGSMIHQNYNSWVTNLNRALQVQLSSL